MGITLYHTKALNSCMKQSLVAITALRRKTVPELLFVKNFQELIEF